MPYQLNGTYYSVQEAAMVCAVNKTTVQIICKKLKIQKIGWVYLLTGHDIIQIKNKLQRKRNKC